MESTDSNELKDLFSDSKADIEPNTPHVVSFKEPEPAEEKKKKNTRKRTREPRVTKPRKYSKQTSSGILAKYNHILKDSRDPLLDDFIAPSENENPTIPTSITPQTVANEKEKEEKKIHDNSQSLKFFTFTNMKEEGKSDADIKARCKKIDEMAPDDVNFELQKITFTQSQHFTDKVAMMLRDGAGFLADKLIGGGGGQIKDEFQRDKELKNAISKKIMNYMGMFGLTSQIALLSGGNVVQGLKNKLQKQPIMNNNISTDNNNKKENDIQKTVIIRGDVLTAR